MALTGLPEMKLTYTLNDAPEHLILSEARKYTYQVGLQEIEVAIYEKFERDMTYSNLPDNLRIKTFVIKRDDALIEAIYQRVRECRLYIEKEILPIMRSSS